MPPCHSVATLRRLLDATVVEDEPQGLREHVQSCSLCQQALDELSAFPDTLAPAPPLPAPVPFPVIRGYEILGLLGRGGMGIVYKARSVHLPGRLVALKVLAPEVAGNEKVRQRFRAEAEAMSRLLHPHIVPIHEVGEHETTPYFTMEWLSGGNLADHLSGRPQSSTEAAHLVGMLARAVQYAHDHGIVHRDLKPANILLSGPGDPGVLSGDGLGLKVADFGLALELDAKTRLTSTNQIVGTPCYMAPEQVNSDLRRVGPATDVYALGAILYECLTGRPPFTAPTILELLCQVAQQAPVSPRRFQPGVSRDLETICLMCLRKEPRTRYATARDLADDLRRFLDGKPIIARRFTPRERFAMWVRRQPAVAALIGVTAVALLSLGLLWLGARRSRKSQVADRVNALAVVSAERLPSVLVDLASFRDDALPLLRQRYQDESAGFKERLRAACGLAVFGEAPWDFLLEAVVRAPEDPGECAGLVSALASRRDEVLPLLLARCRDEKRPALRARIAIVLLHLGEPGGACEVLALSNDPKYRCAFIHGYAAWHGDLSMLPTLLRREASPAFRSGLCAAVGMLPSPRIDHSQRRMLQAVLAELYLADSDSGTHAASGLALRRWRTALPALESGNRPAPDRRWFTNRLGMTLVRIGPGRFRMGEPDKTNTLHEFAIPHDVTLTRPYFICDREVSVDQFRQFMEDKADPAVARPEDWEGANAQWSPQGDHPVQCVNWVDAVLFCNWLSRKEGRTSCYKRAAPMAGTEASAKESKPLPLWRCDFAADGYRLPTEAEWEWACRAGTTTNYVFGDDEGLLPFYATFSSGIWKATTPAGSLLPNAWGLFDMHGNVWEWCWDDYDIFTAAAQVDPTGPPQRGAAGKSSGERVIRGGGICNSSGDWRSASRGGATPLARYANLGFRIACGVKENAKARQD